MSKAMSRLLLVVAAFSVALNIFLLVTRGGKVQQKPSAHQQQPKPPRPDCCRGLAQCQRQRYVAALRALRGQPAPPSNPSPSPNPTPAPKPEPGPAVDTGSKQQQAALCAVAREHLRRAWTQSGAELTRSLRKSLADDADQERGMQREVKRFGDALNLTDADRDHLETHYRPLRKKRIAEALAGLDRDPPDWNTVHTAAQALWRDQDRLTKELFGSDTVAKLRQAELRPRTTVLALVAAQANLDWNQSIAW